MSKYALPVAFGVAGGFVGGATGFSVGIQSADGAENGRRGAMIHAIENGPNMQGAVIEQEIDALEWTRIHSVWRAKSIV